MENFEIQIAMKNLEITETLLKSCRNIILGFEKRIKLFQKHESPKYNDRIGDEHLELIDLLLGSRKWGYDEIHIPKQIYCSYVEELIRFYDLEGKVVVYE